MRVASHLVTTAAMETSVDARNRRDGHKPVVSSSFGISAGSANASLCALSPKTTRKMIAGILCCVTRDFVANQCQTALVAKWYATVSYCGLPVVARLS